MRKIEHWNVSGSGDDSPVLGLPTCLAGVQIRLECVILDRRNTTGFTPDSMAESLIARKKSIRTEPCAWAPPSSASANGLNARAER
jgi:hypothetical protein